MGRDRPVWQAVCATAFPRPQLPQVLRATVLMSLSITTASTPQGAGTAKPGLPVSDNTGTFL